LQSSKYQKPADWLGAEGWDVVLVAKKWAALLFTSISSKRMRLPTISRQPNATAFAVCAV
jgi:hypothetical protein